VSGAPGQPPSEQATLRNSEAHSAIIHRTVQCAIRLSSEPAEQRLPARQRSTVQSYSALLYCNRSQSAEVRGHRIVRCGTDCSVQLEDKHLQRSTALNPNFYADVARTGQCTMTVRCAHRQQPSPMARKWFGAINTPNHLIHCNPSIPNIPFIARAKDFTPRHIQ
jgi:hypothetical protein